MNNPAISPDLTAHLEWCRVHVDQVIDRRLSTRDKQADRLVEAMRYAILGGGKRLRPALVVMACEAAGGAAQTALPAAAAIEMIHTYSLIHDDLPCMDDDDYRRGRLTVHKQYDEATAVLAGDALHALAFEILADCGGPDIVREVAHYIGADGIIGGQMDDLLAEGIITNEQHVSFIHLRKTASLITASVRVGGRLGGTTSAQLEMLTGYGRDIGLAFQIVDDILDEVGSTEQLGKTAGSDRAQQKATYPGVIGIEQSRQRAAELCAAAKRAIAGLGPGADQLVALADYMILRDR
jgi:geranylgeranyl diphosphate synthase type II